MFVTVSARHCDPSDGVRAYARSKANRAAVFSPRTNRVEALLTAPCPRTQAVTFVAHRPGLPPVAASARDADWNAAIDLAQDKLARRLRRDRGKRLDLARAA